MSHGAIELQGLTKTYADSTAVDHIDLTFRAGEFTAILGPSGCGKSTVLGMVGGFVRPDAGDIVLDGRSILRMPPERRPTAMVFQTLALFPHLTVAGNVGFGLRSRRMRKSAIRKRIEPLLELVQLGDLAHRRVSELSGGQRQRVAIARALAVEPAVLLLDEPLSALDAQMRSAMQLELATIQKQSGTTFVYVTHDQHEAMSMADQIVIMRDGRIEQEGTPREIYDAPRTEFVAKFLGDANIVRPVAGRAEQPPVVHYLRTRAGEADSWALRPEHIALAHPAQPVDAAPAATSSGDGGGSGVTGRVTRVTFFGQLIRYEIDVDLAEPVVVMRTSDEPTRAEGDTVALSIDLQRVTPLKGDATATAPSAVAAAGAGS